MKIVIIGSYAPSLTNFRGPLIRELVTSGMEVVVSAPEIDKGLQDQIKGMGARSIEIPLERAGLSVRRDAVYFMRLLTMLREERPDIVLSYTIKPNIWSGLAARIVGIPSYAMVTGLGYAFTQTGGLKQRLVGGVATLLYRAATSCHRGVIFQNPDDVRDFLAAGCLADEDKVHIIAGSGVDMQHYRREDLPDSTVFLMISRLLGNKGVREYATASIRAKIRNPAARFLLVGYFDEGLDGIPKHEVDQWVANGLEYLGPMADIRPIMAQSSVYVLPSYREGTPRSVLEALAVGRPVITTDAPGCRETVIEGHNGFLVPVGDIETLADRMFQLGGDPELRHKMADASYNLAREKYEVGRVNASIFSILGLQTSRIGESLE